MQVDTQISGIDCDRTGLPTGHHGATVVDILEPQLTTRFIHGESSLVGPVPAPLGQQMEIAATTQIVTDLFHLQQPPGQHLSPFQTPARGLIEG